MINKEMLDIMACPLCKADVRLEGAKIICTRPECACRFRIEDDIPVMLMEEAERPCPKCGQQREWLDGQDLLKCAKCGNQFRPLSKGQG
ncbi:MAG: Trm112 family protein [Candidatus Brocadiia bacterium]